MSKAIRIVGKFRKTIQKKNIRYYKGVALNPRHTHRWQLEEKNGFSEWLRLEGISGDHLAQCLAQSRMT